MYAASCNRSNQYQESFRIILNHDSPLLTTIIYIYIYYCYQSSFTTNISSWVINTHQRLTSTVMEKNHPPSLLRPNINNRCQPSPCPDCGGPAPLVSGAPRRARLKSMAVTFLVATKASLSGMDTYATQMAKSALGTGTHRR